MKKEFKIFKEGRTNEKVTILSKNGEDFNREQKINFYLSLGYRVFTLEDEEIVL